MKTPKEKTFAERMRVSENYLEMLAALEFIVIELGRIGANSDLKHPARKAWEVARRAEERGCGKTEGTGV